MVSSNREPSISGNTAEIARARVLQFDTRRIRDPLIPENDVTVAVQNDKPDRRDIEKVGREPCIGGGGHGISNANEFSNELDQVCHRLNAHQHPQVTLNVTTV